jgi:hypothetical protein
MGMTCKLSLIVFSTAALAAACGGAGHSGSSTEDAAGDAAPLDGGLPDAPDGSDAGINLKVQSDHCPTVYAAATPSAAPVGDRISLVATGVDLDHDSLAFLWSARSGTFSAPAAPATDYLCEQAGEQVLAITVSDGNCNGDSTIPVTCQPARP